VASVFVTMHQSVATFSHRMRAELRRHNYVTPTNYLELVSGYKKYGSPPGSSRTPSLQDL
jgi:dynein heavy chain